MTGIHYIGTDAEKPAPGADAVFFRDADAAAFEQIVQRVLTDASVVEIVGNHSVVLEHYARVLIRRLRGQTDVQLEVFLPTGIDNLLERFNSALGEFSVSEAVNGQRQGQPTQVLLLKETGTSHSHDGRILAKLVRSFPAANLKLISLRFEPGSLENTKGLHVTGARSVRWGVETPSVDEAVVLLASIDNPQVKADTQTLLVKIHPSMGEHASLEVSRPRRLTVQSVDDGNETYAPSGTEPIAGKVERKDVYRGRRISLINAGFILAISLMVAATITAVLYPDHIRALADFAGVTPKVVTLPETARTRAGTKPDDKPASPGIVVVGRDGATKPVEDRSVADATTAQTTVSSAPAAAPPPPDKIVAVAPAAPATPPAVLASPPAVPASSSEKAASASASNTAVRSAPAAVSTAPAAPPPAPAAVTVAGRPKEPPPPESSKAAIPPAVKPAQAATEAGVRKSPAAPATQPGDNRKNPPQKAPPVNRTPVDNEVARITNTPGNFFFVQHVALDTREAAERWRADHASFANARVLATRGKTAGQSMFVVINGPFRSTEAADAFMKKRGGGSQYWVRSAASLRKVIDSAEVAGSAGVGGKR